MLKKSIAKFTAIFMLALTVLFPLMGTEKVQAASSKYVTVQISQTFSGTPTEVSNQLNSYCSSHSTYYYNDSLYAGTLNLTYVDQGNTYTYPNYMVVEFKFIYTGTVTEIIYTKTVNVSVLKSFIATSEYDFHNQFAQYYAYNYTYFYDDGRYKGTIGYKGYEIISILPYGSQGAYMYNVKINYGGTVTSYIAE